MLKPAPAARLAATVAFLVLVPAAALASSSIVRWSAPIRIIASEPNVPTAINGFGHVVTLRPGSGPGPALQLATAGGPVRTEQLQTTVGGYNHPAVAIAGGGSLAAVWDTSSTNGGSIDRLEVALGTFSAPPTTATVLATGSDSFADEQAYETSTGTAVVLWDETGTSGAKSVRAIVVPAGASIASPVTLDAGAVLVGAGVDGKGDVIVVDAGPSPSFIEHRIAPNGMIGPAQDFTNARLALAMREDYEAPGVLVDGAGDQLFYWTNVSKHHSLWTQWRSSAGALGSVQTLGISAAGSDEVAPTVALNAAGDAVALLTPYGAGQITVRFASRLGSFSTTRLVGAPDRSADMPSVSIDGSDRTLVTWIDYSHPGSPAAREVYAEAHGTSFGAPAPLAFGPGIGHLYLSDEPLAAAAASAAQTVVTYAGSAMTNLGLTPIGQIAFPQD